MRLLEEKEETEEAQNYKLRYEQKQRQELCTDEHKILFFTEFLSLETEDKYYLPNGKYWEFRKQGKILARYPAHLNAPALKLIDAVMTQLPRHPGD